MGDFFQLEASFVLTQNGRCPKKTEKSLEFFEVHISRKHPRLKKDKESEALLS